MSSALGYLFLLLPVVAVVWIIWRYQRRSGDKETRSSEREAALVSLAKAPPRVPAQEDAGATAAAAPAVVGTPRTAVAVPPAAVAAPAVVAALNTIAPPDGVSTSDASSPAAVAAPPVAVTVPAPLGRRDRFLTHSETLIYFLLRTGMPGHEVFPRVSLDAVVANSPTAPESPGESAAHDLDFVVCDKRMRIVAAIQVKGRLAGPESARVVESLAAAGIRLVTVDPRALPKRDELGALVLGAAE